MSPRVVLLTLLVLAGCAGARDAATTAEPAQDAPSGVNADAAAPVVPDAGSGVADAGAPDPLAVVRGLLRPWHHLETASIARARYVLVARYETGRYPCVVVRRIRRMPLRQSFRIEQQLRGRIPHESFDASYSSPDDPAHSARLVYGRRYLLLLDPSKQSERWLLNPDHVFSLRERLSTEDFVAVIDLDATEEEALLRRRAVERLSAWEASSFSADAWRALRGAPRVELDEVLRTMHVLRRQVISRGALRSRLRALLGPPDSQRPGGVEVYELSLAVRRAPGTAEDDTLLGRVELTYDDSARLRRYVEEFDVVESGRARAATPEELRARGVESYELDLTTP